MRVWPKVTTLSGSGSKTGGVFGGILLVPGEGVVMNTKVLPPSGLRPSLMSLTCGPNVT